MAFRSFQRQRLKTVGLDSFVWSSFKVAARVFTCPILFFFAKQEEFSPPSDLLSALLSRYVLHDLAVLVGVAAKSKIAHPVGIDV